MLCVSHRGATEPAIRAVRPCCCATPLRGPTRRSRGQLFQALHDRIDNGALRATRVDKRTPHFARWPIISPVDARLRNACGA